jgi:hypothetical protein
VGVVSINKVVLVLLLNVIKAFQLVGIQKISTWFFVLKVFNGLFIWVLYKLFRFFLYLELDLIGFIFDKCEAYHSILFKVTRKSI